MNITVYVDNEKEMEMNLSPGSFLALTALVGPTIVVGNKPGSDLTGSISGDQLAPLAARLIYLLNSEEVHLMDVEDIVIGRATYFGFKGAELVSPLLALVREAQESGDPLLWYGTDL